MATCDEISKLVGARLDGELETETAARVASHLAACEACRLEAERLADLRARLAELAGAQPRSERLWARIEARLDGGAGSPDARRPRTIEPQARGPHPLGSRRRWAPPALAAAAAASIVALALVAQMGPGSLSPPDPAAGPERERDLSTYTRDSRRFPRPLALEVGYYVEEVASRPEPRAFWNRYRAETAAALRPPDWPELEFEPLVPETLPGGFRLVDAKLLSDACCRTLQLRYRAGDRWVDLFECHDTHPVEFGEVRVERVEIGGVASSRFRWRGSPVVGRSVVRAGVNLVLVGNVDERTADSLIASLIDD